MSQFKQYIDPIKIAQMINDVYDGVERSKVGPIVQKDENGRPIINHVPFQTYLSILSNVTPKQVINSLTQQP